jgi:hypothetical protein
MRIVKIARTRRRNLLPPPVSRDTSRNIIRFMAKSFSVWEVFRAFRGENRVYDKSFVYRLPFESLC